MSYHKRRNTVFPSYDAVYKKIQAEQTKQYEDKLNTIKSRIKNFKSKIDFDEEHRRLAKKLIIQYKKQPLYERPLQEELTDLAVIYGKRTTKFANSLNEYLQNSEEEENNYESHLKFRKKALQRELQANLDGRKLAKSRKIKYNAEEQQFFKNLYIGHNSSSNKENMNQKKELQSQYLHLAQNKRKLTEFYLPYVQALGQTNIVKWRILN